MRDGIPAHRPGSHDQGRILHAHQGRTGPASPSGPRRYLLYAGRAILVSSGHPRAILCRVASRTPTLFTHSRTFGRAETIPNMVASAPIVVPIMPLAKLRPGERTAARGTISEREGSQEHATARA